MKNSNIYKVDAHILRVFLKVCELKSVSRAAEYFDITQSTVSNMMDRLRQILGYKLFEKVGRNIVPTENAKELIPRATSIITAIETLPDTGTYDPEQDKRPVTILGNLNSLIGVLQCIRTAIWDKAPSCPIRFLELGSRDQFEDRLNDTMVDFAISVRTPKYPPTVASQPLFRDRSVVYFDPRHRTAPVDRKDYFTARHGVFDFGGLSRSSVDQDVRGHQAHRKIVCSASNAGMLSHLIEGTDIIASMPSHLRHHPFRNLSWAPLPLSPNSILNFDLLWHKRNAESSRHKWLLETISAADTQAAADTILD